ncbi:helix-turn-helix transcriptional regulator [Microcoleus sp. M2_D5]|uniref:helix-turn-helix transcriptional regulator n=3 Tax=Microcoleus TaxID=44471 RepID=UPI002FD2545C
MNIVYLLTSCQLVDYIRCVLCTMPVMNKLRSVLVAKGIENANQLRVATKKADSQKKGIGQATALSAWNDPFWLPNASTLQLICRAFNIQPGDFLFYLEDDAAEVDEVVEMKETLNGR